MSNIRFGLMKGSEAEIYLSVRRHNEMLPEEIVSQECF